MAASALSSASSRISPSLRLLLNQEFKTMDDLSRAPALLDRLSGELNSCEDLISHLQSRILNKLDAWSSCSSSLSSSLAHVSQRIQDLLHRSDQPADASVEAGVKADPAAHEKSDLVEQLPTLAVEVARVERVRLYAETALKLEALVGDLEDAVASIVMVTPRIQLPRKMVNSPASDVVLGLSNKFTTAINALQNIEDVVSKLMASWPQWKRLFFAVDNRVDGAVASLRPSAVADYRLKLVAIGWPPLLSAGITQGDYRNKKSENPLLEMYGDSKTRFEQSFVTLSTLQAVQSHRKARQLSSISQYGNRLQKGRTLKSVDGHELLWTMEELVAPIGERAEYHFLKWNEKPDLIFGLAYRIAQQYIKSVDLVLQPMLDRVRLAGYCVREEWVSAIVSMVVRHLRSHVLVKLAERLLDDDMPKDVSALWLHMVDLAIDFDKKMRSLALQPLGALISNLDLDAFEEIEVDIQPTVKCVSVFAEQREWLELWAHIELADARDKLRLDLQRERGWLSDDKSILLGTAKVEATLYDEKFKAPHHAETAMTRMWMLVNRCRSLLQPDWQLSFITCVGVPFVKSYLGDLLQKCQEAEALTALAEEDAVLKVAICINAGYYCEYKLQEWSEDVFFLNLRLLQISQTGDSEKSSEQSSHEMTEVASSVQGSIFDGELACLMQFRTEWMQKLVSAIQRTFEASCQEYQRNKKRWQDVAMDDTKGDQISTEGVQMDLEIGVSPSLIDALALLQGRLRVLKGTLGNDVFLDMWRSLASSLDLFFLNGIIVSGIKFSMYGSRQLVKDIDALLQVFRPYCLRPASFFLNLSDAVVLLTLPAEDVAALQKSLSSASNWQFKENTEEVKLQSLREYGVRWISPAIAGRILLHQILPK